MHRDKTELLGVLAAMAVPAQRKILVVIDTTAVTVTGIVSLG